MDHTSIPPRTVTVMEFVIAHTVTVMKMSFFYDISVAVKKKSRHAFRQKKIVPPKK